MRRTTVLAVTAAAVAGSALLGSPASAEDSMARGVSKCAQLHADYPNGIAKTGKAARAAVREGYRRPFVCKRVYLKLATLDTNRNKSVCETR